MIDYMAPRWRELRYQAWKRADGHCERCDRLLLGGKWHLHHRHYKTVGQEALADVEAICVPCHQLEHPNKKILTGKQIEREKRQKRKAKWRKDRGLPAKSKKERRKEKRRRRALPYRRPRSEICPKCHGELSRVEHEKECLGLRTA